MSLLGSGLDTGGRGLAAPPRMELPAQEEVLLREQKRGRQSLKGGRGTAGVASGEPTKSPQIFKCD